MNDNLKIHVIYGIFGIAMGVILSSIGFADYDEVFKMFTFTDTRMFFAFVSAVIMSSAVFSILHFTKRLPFDKKPFHPGTIPGSIMFIQLGQGKMAAVATLVGIYAGVMAYRKYHALYFQWDTGSCGA